jgi:hypothetical protein
MEFYNDTVIDRHVQTQARFKFCPSKWNGKFSFRLSQYTVRLNEMAHVGTRYRFQ